MLTDCERYILLNLVPDIGSARLKQLLEAFGGLDEVWAASETELRRVPGVGPVLAQRLTAGRGNTRLLEQELRLAEAAKAQILTLEETGYPAALRQIHDPPLALYIRGSLPIEEIAVAMVGSRHASHYGLETAQRLAYDLALRGVTIVSGLARGIDGAAHRGALKAGGRTIAVLGSGLSVVYPPEHEELSRQIIERGALVSEYPMTMQPLPHNFPRRNRIISGLSLGVVVVEAAARSGALITADCALEQGREVFAVPGPITTPTSQGTHHLLKQGAALVTSAEDILEELGLTAPQPARPSAARAPAQAPDDLAAEEQQVFACLSRDEPRYIDTITETSGMEAMTVSSALLQLELRHLIRQLPGKQFLRT